MKKLGGAEFVNFTMGLSEKIELEKISNPTVVIFSNSLHQVVQWERRTRENFQSYSSDFFQ